MLRLPDLSGKGRKTKSFFRQVLPHVGLVLVASVYLLFGAIIFYHLERPHDQRARISAKIRLNREIRQLTTLIYYQSKYYQSPTTAMFEAYETSTTPVSIVSTSDDSADIPEDTLELEGSGNDIFSDAWTEWELGRAEDARKIERQIFNLLHRWEDAIREYDIRASHVFTEDFLVDNRWHNESNAQEQLRATESRWTFSASVLFAFTVITTIGYGNLTPQTVAGKSFCMIYGLFGIPMTMLAIANVGRFLSEAIELLVDKIRRERAYREIKAKTQLHMKRRASRLAGQFFHEVVKREDIDLKPLPAALGHISLLLCFALYIIMGALCLPLWEDLNFFDGCYFSFVTITTVGFGDIVPRRYDYLFPTLVYITIGLAITTLTIEIFGRFLRQVHYLGSKIKGAKNAFIWFGNKMLTVQELVTAIGRQYGIPEVEIDTLNSNMDDVIKTTVQHKEEERRIHRQAHSSKRKGIPDREGSKTAALFADAEFRYIDEETPQHNEQAGFWKHQPSASKKAGKPGVTFGKNTNSVMDRV